MSRNVDSYEKSVLASLKSGPKPRYELTKVLTPKVMSTKKLQRTLNELERAGKIICEPRRIGASHKWTSLYALPQDKALIKTAHVSTVNHLKTGRKPTTLEGRVRRAVDKLRYVLMRNPTMIEIAYEIGETPEIIRETAFALAPKTEWKEPSEKQISMADDKNKKVYEIARLLKHFPPNVVQKRSRYCLRDYSWDWILDRVNYARRFEQNKLPKIVAIKKDKQQIEFKFIWPKGSKWSELHEHTEYYYKKERKFRSYWEVFAEFTTKMIEEAREELRESRK